MSYEAGLKGRDLVMQVREDLRDLQKTFGPVHRLMGREVEFALELKQYREQRTRQRDSGRRVRPVSTGIFRLWRYKKAMARAKAPPHINCVPRDNLADPDSAEAMKEALEWETTGQTWKQFSDTRDRWIGSALAMRAGCYRWDWHPELGQYGEILPRPVDPRNVFWTRGYLTPHDPMCPDFYEIFRIPVTEAARRGWKNTRDLKPDDGVATVLRESGWGTYTNIPGSVDLADGDYDRNYVDTVGSEKEFFTGVICHQRFAEGFDPTQFALDPRDQTMLCPSCGWESEPQGAQQDVVYPQRAANACPICSGDMHKVTSRKMDADTARAARGKKMLIASLNNSVDVPLYEGMWSVPTARSFPYAWLVAYRFPHLGIPESDVSLNWTVTVGENFTLRVLYEQAHRSRGLWLLPSVGLEDRNGARYDLGDDQDDVAFYTRNFPPKGVDFVQPAPVTTSLFQLHDMLEQAFRTNEGTSDISVPPDMSKSIPVGTIEQMVETGNVPMNDFVEQIYEAESMSFGILSDYIRYTWNVARWVRYFNDQGQAMFKSVKGANLPDVDVQVSSGPNLSRIRTDQLEAYMKIVALPPDQQQDVGQLLGLDPQLMKRLARRAAAAVPPGAPPGAPPGLPGPPGMALPPPIASRMGPMPPRPPVTNGAANGGAPTHA